MDNRQIDLSLEGIDDFKLAMKLACSSKKTTGFRIADNKFILYKASSEKATQLPYEMDVEEITNFAWGWLNKNKPSEKEPDHDGHNKRGFRIYNESWGMIGCEWQTFLVIEPIWAMYGK